MVRVDWWGTIQRVSRKSADITKQLEHTIALQMFKPLPQAPPRTATTNTAIPLVFSGLGYSQASSQR